MKSKRSSLVPAAARPDTGVAALTEEEKQLSAAAVETFAKVLGGRSALVDALVVAEDAPEVDRVVSLLLEPRYSRHSLRSICELAGLTIADVFAAYKKAALVRAHLALTPIIVAKLTGIVDDVLTRAQPHYLPCETCKATGQLLPAPTAKVPNPELVTCHACNGAKQLLHLPDLDRQKLALEIAEVVKPRAPLFQQQINQLNQASDHQAMRAGSLEQLQQAVSSILYQHDPVVDVVPEESHVADPSPVALDSGAESDPAVPDALWPALRPHGDDVHGRL